MAISWTLMLSWAMLSRRSGSLIFRKRGRSWTSQFMSRRCNKQVCTHDRAGSRTLESRDKAHITPPHTYTWNYTYYCCKHFFYLTNLVVWTWCFTGSLLLIEATEALYCLHQHEHQLMVGTPHLRSQFVPTVWQLREITEKRQENNKLFTQTLFVCLDLVLNCQIDIDEYQQHCPETYIRHLLYIVVRNRGQSNYF